MLKLERPLCSIDCETTGTDIIRDRIVSLAIIKIMPDGARVPYHWLFNPGIEMTPEVIAIHGITHEKSRSVIIEARVEYEQTAMTSVASNAGHTTKWDARANDRHQPQPPGQ